MRIISQKKIKDFYGLPQYEQAKIPLQQWYYTIRNRDYRSFAQILVDFGDMSSALAKENTRLPPRYISIQGVCMCGLWDPLLTGRHFLMRGM